jgi:hypothetical protein
MILGIQWLRTLWPILWDFLNLTIQFVYEKRTCLLEVLLLIFMLVEKMMNLLH